MRRVNVGGVGFDDVTMDEAVTRIVAMAHRRDRPRYVCTGNLDHMVTLQQDADFRLAYVNADLVLADGMPIVWLSRLCSRRPLRERVAGSDLFWELARASETTGLRLFFLGGVLGAAERARDAVLQRFPRAEICGIYCPPFSEFGREAEEAKIAAAIAAAAPQVLLVAFGAPKQEKWIIATQDRLRIPVSIGVGGSFEMAAGLIARAPRWAQRSGMEWVYRLVQEPRRMWRRYLCRDLPFFCRLGLRLLFAGGATRGQASSGPGD